MACRKGNSKTVHGNEAREFIRTANRHDYALSPTGRTVLNALKESGRDVISVGKISDIFNMQGITEVNRSKSSVHGMEQTIAIADRDFDGLCYVNLVDFDALWGHRRNPQEYGDELERFDVKLGELLGHLRSDDLLMITADHGNIRRIRERTIQERRSLSSCIFTFAKRLRTAR